MNDTNDVSERMAKALVILLQPEEFKVCEGCDSIVTRGTRICPSCHAYRFIDDVDVVVKQTKKLSISEQQSVTKNDLFD